MFKHEVAKLEKIKKALKGVPNDFASQDFVDAVDREIADCLERIIDMRSRRDENWRMK